jgi:hypothetical protein
LQDDPHGWGDPERHLVGTDAVVCHGILRPIVFRYDVPVDAVLEAIDYCTHNEELLRQEREEDLADLRTRGLLSNNP